LHIDPLQIGHVTRCMHSGINPFWQ